MAIFKLPKTSLKSYLFGNESSSMIRSNSARSYGATMSASPSLVPPLNQGSPSSPLVGPPRRERTIRICDLEDLTEDEDEIEELIDVPYSTLIRNYSLVPISSFLFIIALITLVSFAWPPASDVSHPDYPYRPHWSDLLVGAATWVVSYSLRIPIFLLMTLFGRLNGALPTILSTVVHILIEEALRLSSLLLLSVHLTYFPSHRDWVPFPDTQDVTFRRIFWFALGWAIVEVCWSISQGYEQLALYRDLLTQEDESYINDDQDDIESVSHRYVHSAFKSISPPEPYRRILRGIDRSDDTPFDLEQEMTQLIAIQHRNELEMVYGVPPPNIPVFISILQRLDSILLALGLTLIIASAYLTELANHPLIDQTESTPTGPSTPAFPPILDTQAALYATLPTFLGLVMLHASLAVMWTEALPRIGVHTASYAALLVALAIFFAGLASWGGLS